MAVNDLRLQHFRSYEDDSFEFSPAVNIIVGPNASGKTNLLEAILVLARGSSYRVKDSDLVQFDAPWARLDTHTTEGDRVVKIITAPLPHKTYEIDGKAYGRLSQHHSLPVVLFEPNHLNLLSGSPDVRRAYLDDLLEQIQPGYATLRRNYRRTLAQRNNLLKKGLQVAEAQIFAWNIRLSEQAGKIVKARTELVDAINEQIPKLYGELSHARTKTAVAYASPLQSHDYETRLLKQLEARLETDVVRGFTTMGPHREDMVVTFNGHIASETASRGEARTLVLALKIIELETLRRARGQTPLLLLDDVFSELDGTRRRALTSYLEQYQTFITTTDADVVIKHFTEIARIIPLSN
ncbi:MAG TPA: DNA replication/repair protein RecF [Candidatus Saccharimonadales bacterium]|nr:DNA replication/repair protein RecF [Candidatus Saccharimonadales bacterium]